MLEIVEYTDPACPWAWGSEPVLHWLRLALGVGAGADAADRVSWRRVFGILFDEDEDPPPDPAAETAWYARWLAGVSGHTRAPLPLRLAWVCRTSWPASLVAKAAERQGAVIADRVLRRLRETTFVDGEPADTLAAALSAVAGVRGLDTAVLARDAGAADVRAAVEADRAECRRPDPAVDRYAAPAPHPGRRKELASGDRRYGLPTVHVVGPAGERWLPGWRPLGDYVAALRAVDPARAFAEVRRSGDLLVGDVGSVTSAELDLLSGGLAPVIARPVATLGGVVWRGI